MAMSAKAEAVGVGSVSHIVVSPEIRLPFLMGLLKLGSPEADSRQRFVYK